MVAGQFGGRCGGIGGNTGECCRLGDRVEPFPVGTTDRVKALGGWIRESTVPSVPRTWSERVRAW
ncbi:hypothetical protein EI32_0482 [Mycobacterium tuberculosis]|nr:hypothetical protein HX90_0468 [Mycobacterium tuberculosis]KRT47246.1 hypothetical protein EI32_0482 [Mycobacterium tuberculosis]